MSRQTAIVEAIGAARAALATVDLGARAAGLGLGRPEGAALALRMFGADLVLTVPDLELRAAASGHPAKPADLLLLLHALRYAGPPLRPGGAVAFREFAGGAFYLGPFQARTLQPLVRRLGNGLANLRRNLDRFDWQPVAQGDLGARIRAFGHLSVTLVYQCGDDELGPSADLTFATAVHAALDTEDAAVLASRICLGLL